MTIEDAKKFSARASVEGVRRRCWEIEHGINLNPGFTEYDDGKTPPGKNAAHIARLKAMTREERAKYLADTYGIR